MTRLRRVEARLVGIVGTPDPDATDVDVVPLNDAAAEALGGYRQTSVERSRLIDADEEMLGR